MSGKCTQHLNTSMTMDSGPKSTALHVLLCLTVWWGASSFANVFTKQALKDGMPSMQLSALQLLTGGMLGWMGLVVQLAAQETHSAIAAARLSYARLQAAWSSHARAMVGLGIAQALGTLATTVAMRVGPAPLIQIVKATEPMCVLALQVAFMRAVPSKRLVLGVTIMVLGVALLTSSQPHVSWQGLSLGFMANLAFASRNILTSTLCKSSLPVGSAEVFIMFSLTGGLGLCVMVVVAGWAAGWSSSLATVPAAAWLACILHGVYNMASTHLLQLLSVESHAVANLLKRVLIVWALQAVFGELALTLSSIGAILVVFAGFAVFLYAKVQAKAHGHRDGSAAPTDLLSCRCATRELCAAPSRWPHLACLAIIVSALALGAWAGFGDRSVARFRQWASAGGTAAGGAVLAHGYYEGYIGRGNLGDELLFTEAAEMLRHAVSRRVGYALPPVWMDLDARPGMETHLKRRDGDCFHITAGNSSIIAPGACADFSILGGGSLMLPWHTGKLLPFAESGGPVLLFGTGFQDLQVPLEYDTVHALATTEHQNTSITSLLPTEFRDRVCPTLRRVHRNFQLGGVRGPLSKKLVSACSPGFGLPVLYDAGLLAAALFQASAQERRLLDSIQSNADIPLIAVNYFHCGNHYCTGRAEALKDAMAAAVQHTLAALPTARVVLYAMEPGQLDHGHSLRSSVLDMCAAREQADCGARMHVLQEVPSAGFVVEMHRRGPFSLSMKLHSMILSAAAGTPFVNIAYLLKAFDFGASVQLLQYVLPAHTASSHDMVSLVSKLLDPDALAAARGQIQQHTAWANVQQRIAFDMLLMRVESAQLPALRPTPTQADKAWACPAGQQLRVAARTFDLGGELVVHCSLA